ncbi:SpoIIE family protein phosphatase [Paludisphaera sp.]|uniref:PP2C family protein-serine/threonine phosphatase n=1 Tax=Paludisphaera sp. TaxID=2017432 RepID=UPI00301CAC7E
MTLRYKFVLPVNLILLVVLLCSLGWEWRRQEAAGMALLRSRLDEEARFIHAAGRTFGPSPRLEEFLNGFCHAMDPSASPEHQVSLIGAGGRVVATASEHARRPLDPARFAAAGDGFHSHVRDGETFLVRVSSDGEERVVVAESTRAVEGRVRETLRRQAGWFLGAGALLLGAVNFVIRRAVLRPIGRISRAVGQLERGKLGAQVESPNGDELGALARRFNAMSRALAEQADAERREMETARRVQEHLLPPAELRLGCLVVAGRCLPDGPVGGDLYDVQPLPGGRVGVLLVDMSGHNVAAALHTAMVRAIVWREAADAAGPGEVLARLNERLCVDLPDERFATAFLAWFEPGSRTLRYANAGHPPALLRHASGSTSELEPTMPLLGIFEDMPAIDAQAPVERGSRLLVFSDGLIEVADSSGRMWGAAELGEILAAGEAMAPARIVDRLLERRAEVISPESPRDDVTVVVADYEPAAVRDDLEPTGHADGVR